MTPILIILFRIKQLFKQIMEEDNLNYSSTVMFRVTPCMSQMNPKEVVHNTAYSVQLPYIAGHSL